MLLPLNRNMRLIHELMEAYQRLFGENLRERLIDEMSGSELDYALYLLGGPAMRAQPEITEVTDQQARELFDEMARLTFWTTDEREAPIPFHYPPDGCYARAHLMAQRLTELGIASQKVFAVSRAPGGLTVQTPLASDMPPAQQATPAVNWWYHVAPVIRVRNAQGQIIETVIDPSLAGGPITIDDWWRKMRTDRYDRLTPEQIQELRNPVTGEYPAGRNLLFTTGRDVFFPTEDVRGSTPEQAAEQMENVRGRLTNYAMRASVHELAAFVRMQLAAPVPNVAALVARLQAAAPWQRQALRVLFPNLLAAIFSRLGPADRTTVQNVLLAP